MKSTRPSFLTRSLTYVLIAAVSLQVSLTSRAESISPDEPHAASVDAYVYFYSFVTMDITRKQLTDVGHADRIQG
jgi:hypothetical protein